MAASEEANLEFWRRLFDAPRIPLNPFNRRTPGPSSWVGTVSHIARSCISIATRGTEREAIENEFGEPLEWLRLDDKRASIVRKSIPGKGLSDRDAWDEIIVNLHALQERFEKVFRPRVTRIQV